MHDDLERAFDLSGRVAVVTGAASGIGRAASLVFAKAGAHLVVADRDREALAETADAISALGQQVVSAVTDVACRSEVDALVDTAVSRFGGLDVMANVAGIMRNGMFLEVTEQELDEIIGINQKGVFFGCQAAARAMVAGRGGSIINLASAGMDSPAPNVAAYAMTKAAVAMMTRSLAIELGSAGIRVNTVAPGFVDTNMTRRHWVDESGRQDLEARDAIWNEMSARVPLGAIGEPSDVAYAMLYLASDASKFVTGQVLRPNGGVAMP